MFENIGPPILILIFVSTINLILIPLIATTFLWLASKLWRFKEKSLKTSLYVILIIFGAMIVVLEVFIDEFAQRFWLISLVSLAVGLVAGVIAIKKLFQESFTKSIGALLTSFMFTIVFLSVIILGFYSVSFSDVFYSLFTKPVQYSITEIRIIPIGSVFREDTEMLDDILRQEFPQIKTSIAKSIELPLNAFDAEKQQYNATVLLEEVTKLAGDEQIRLIGVTEEDLFTPGLNFIFSTAEPRGNSIVMSFKRLRPTYDPANPNQRVERYQKIVLRALGLTFGFKPSSNRNCVMAFSNSLPELDSKGTAWCGDELKFIQRIQGL